MVWMSSRGSIPFSSRIYPRIAGALPNGTKS